jgi:putative ABC transport system permease protein
VIGLGLLVIWGVPWPALVGEGTLQEVVSEGPWVLLSFVLTGPLLILGAILVIMFNADAWTWGVNQLLGGFGALTPVLKTAIAYPLSTRFRTGMSMLLFAMVIATVTIMAVVIEATQTIVAPDQERTADFDIEIEFSLLSFFDPITDLSARIATNPEAPVAEIAAVGAVAAQGNEVRVQGEAAWRRATLVGVNTGYWEQAETVYTFGQRAPGFDSDEAVWEALRTQENVAVVTQQVVSRPFGPGQRDGPPASDADDPDDEDFVRRLQLAEFVGDTGTLPALYLEFPAPVEDGAMPAPVQIIGVLDANATLAGEGIQVSDRTYAAITGVPFAGERFYVKTQPGADVRDVARRMERAFLGNAVEATVMADSFAQSQALTRGILQLLQGFMALGLLVGIAALGVVSSRTVVERRQQVGMLRAIGFQPNMVALSFLLEASFIALSGLAIGAVAGAIVGQNMVGLFFEALAGGRTFVTPWGQIGLLVALAYGFALLTTFIPAYQASRIYPAEALRYE